MPPRSLDPISMPAMHTRKGLEMRNRRLRRCIQTFHHARAVPCCISASASSRPSCCCGTEAATCIINPPLYMCIRCVSCLVSQTERFKRVHTPEPSVLTAHVCCICRWHRASRIAGATTSSATAAIHSAAGNGPLAARRNLPLRITSKFDCSIHMRR